MKLRVSIIDKMLWIYIIIKRSRMIVRDLILLMIRMVNSIY